MVAALSSPAQKTKDDFPWLPVGGFVLGSVAFGFLVQVADWVTGIRMMPFRAAGLAWGFAWPFILVAILQALRANRISLQTFSAAAGLLSLPFVDRCLWGRYAFLAAGLLWCFSQVFPFILPRQKILAAPAWTWAVAAVWTGSSLLYWLAPESWAEAAVNWKSSDPFWSNLLLENLS